MTTLAPGPGRLSMEATLGRWTGAEVGRSVSLLAQEVGNTADPSRWPAKEGVSLNLHLSYHHSSAGPMPKRDRKIQLSEGSRYSRTASHGFWSFRARPGSSYLPM